MLANGRAPRHTFVQQRVRTASVEDCCGGGYRSPAENRVRKYATLTISMPLNATSRSKSSSPVTMVSEPALTAHSSTRLSSGSVGTVLIRPRGHDVLRVPSRRVGVRRQIGVIAT